MGLREMRRVARRVVVFTFDASDTDGVVGSGLLATTCLRSPTSSSAGLRDRAGPRDRSPHGAGARSVGLR